MISRNHIAWLNLVLLACYAFVISSGQSLTLGTLLNSDAVSAISKEPSQSQPFTARPVLAQWKHVVPSSNSVSPLDAIVGRMRERTPERTALLALPLTYTTLISHFPYPPFWPRDPSRV